MQENVPTTRRERRQQGLTLQKNKKGEGDPIMATMTVALLLFIVGWIGEWLWLLYVSGGLIGACILCAFAKEVRSHQHTAPTQE